MERREKILLLIKSMRFIHCGGTFQGLVTSFCPASMPPSPLRPPPVNPHAACLHSEKIKSTRERGTTSHLHARCCVGIHSGKTACSHQRQSNLHVFNGFFSSYLLHTATKLGAQTGRTASGTMKGRRQFKSISEVQTNNVQQN